MIVGFVNLDADSVNTHRDSYLLKNLTVVSVRRPFFAAGLLFGIGALSFVTAFSDLLYLHEMAVMTALAAFCLLSGYGIAQLKLISRETKGTELAGAVWGSYPALQTVRQEIVAAIRTLPQPHHGGGVAL
ncbi:MAG: hypothetical protein AAFY42_12995 [Pseudomonadota bacterium]